MFMCRLYQVIPMLHEPPIPTTPKTHKEVQSFGI